MPSAAARLALGSMVCALLLGGCHHKVLIIDSPRYHYRNGVRFLESGKFDEAETEFMTAIAIDPGYAPAEVGLGLVAGSRGEEEEATRHIRRAKDLFEAQGRGAP